MASDSRRRRPKMWRHAAAATAFLLLQLSPAGASASNRPSLQSTAETLASYVGMKQGWSAELTKLSGINFADAKVQHVLAYEASLTVRGKRREFAFTEEITPWNHLVPALPLPPIAQTATQQQSSTPSPAPSSSSDSHSPPGLSSEAASGSRTQPEGAGAGLDVTWKSVEEQGLALVGDMKSHKEQQAATGDGPVLPPFVLEGPLELWIEGVTQLRLAMPHDVDAGDVRKVVVGAGAAVTVAGCQEVSLARPLQVPLPLKLPEEGEVEGETSGHLALLDLTAKLRKAASAWQGDSSARVGATAGAGAGTGGGAESRRKQTLALRIVRPTSITAAAPTPQALPGDTREGTQSAGTELIGPRVARESTAVVPRMRVRRLSAKSVELQLRDQGPLRSMDPSYSAESGQEGMTPVVSPSPSKQARRVSQAQRRGERGGERVSMWPFAFENASHARLAGFEEALLAALGESAHRRGTFQLTRARAAVRKLVSVPFQVELQSPYRHNFTSMLGMGPPAVLNSTDGEGERGEDARLGRRGEGEEGGEGVGERGPFPVARQQWEVLLQEGYHGELQPVHLKQLGSVQPTIVLAPGLLAGNSSAPSHNVAPQPPSLQL